MIVRREYPSFILIAEKRKLGAGMWQSGRHWVTQGMHVRAEDSISTLTASVAVTFP